MKVALCFFGQPRFVDNQEVYSSFQNTILKYNPDVYAHVWYKDGADYDYSSWSHLTTHGVPPKAIQIIRDQYNPKNIMLSEPKTFTLPDRVMDYIKTNFQGPLWTDKNFSNLVSQLYSIQYVLDYLHAQISVLGIRYDWIVLARYDTVISNFPNLESLDTSKLYLPNTHRGFPDMINIFPPKYLDWGRSLYKDIPFVYEGIHEPTPEAFKMNSFLSRHSRDELSYNPVSAIAIRK